MELVGDIDALCLTGKQSETVVRDNQVEMLLHQTTAEEAMVANGKTYQSGYGTKHSADLTIPR